MPYNSYMDLLRYTVNPVVKPETVRDLLKRAEMDRAEEDADRLVRIAPEANIVLACYDGGKLVGLARGLKEMSGCCYLSDLVVDRAYQSRSVGEQLIRRVRQVVGEHALILLVRASDVAVYNTGLS